MIQATIQLLTSENFAPFGDVIGTAEAQTVYPINAGMTQRFHDMARIDLLGENARPMISIFRGSAYHAPIELHEVERHPLGSQAFIPLQQQPYLVAVAPAHLEVVRAQDIRVFLASGQQGVNYRAGVWHHSLLALNDNSDFLVVDRGGDGNNCDTIPLDQPLRIQDLPILG